MHLIMYSPETPLFDCVIRAFGKNFETTAFLSEITFPKDAVLFKGIFALPEEIKTEMDNIDSLFKEVFFDIEKPRLVLRLSKETKFEKQLQDAIGFFNTFFDDLIKLSNYPNVEYISLEFMSEDYSNAKIDNFPKEFFELTSKCGIGGISFGGKDENESK